MRFCSIVKNVTIEKGSMSDYNKLSRFHYRNDKLGPYTAIWVMKINKPIKATCGVIVYSMPTVGLELRRKALAGTLDGIGKTALSLINRNVRRISRVIIEPRFRGLGLAHRLVKETLPNTNTAIVEALAVMGKINPFFEKAGMKAYSGEIPARYVRLKEAFDLVGIEEDIFIEPEKIQKKIASLKNGQADFIEFEIQKFLQSYGRKAQLMARGLERTEFVLSKLSARPVYYIWFNPDIEFIS